jgi:hypothetical protein
MITEQTSDEGVQEFLFLAYEPTWSSGGETMSVVQNCIDFVGDMGIFVQSEVTLIVSTTL